MKLPSLLTGLLLATKALGDAAPEYDFIPRERHPGRSPSGRDITTAGLLKSRRGSLSHTQRIEYINAVQCLAQKQSVSPKADFPGACNHYDDFVAQHIKSAPHVHFSGLFYPFHRYFIHLYETALRNECGYKGAQPYWDWTLAWQDPVHSTIFDGSPTSLGGNGEFIPDAPPTKVTAFGLELNVPHASGGGCVQSGPFHEGTWTVNLGPATLNSSTNPGPNGLGYNPRCLTRDISTVYAANTRPTKVRYQLEHCGDDFECFGTLTEDLNGTHTGGHCTWGGDPGYDPYASPGDPVFWLHHAQVDRLWTIWQALNPKVRAKQTYGTETAFNCEAISPPLPFYFALHNACCSELV
ncbi:MAG: hypothetical protein Q9212_004135 [Teloschistes hypoglaucus]